MKRQNPKELLDMIAELILANPAISVRDLKSQLGYAEEKSIYYWLRKLGIHGIKEFRNAVLTKKYIPGVSFSLENRPEELKEEAENFFVSGSLPLVTAFTAEGEPVLEGEKKILLPPALSKAAYLYQIPARETAYIPLLNPKDILVVEPVRTPDNGSLILIWDGKEISFRRFYHGHPFLLVHPTRPQWSERFLSRTPGPSRRIQGQVRWLIRGII